MSGTLQTPDYAAGTRPLILRVRGSALDGREVRMQSVECLVGSGADCTLRLRSESIAPRECLIRRGRQGAVVRALSPTTLLNGKQFGESSLRAGDWLSVGPLMLEVVDLGAVAPSPPSVAPHSYAPLQGPLDELRGQQRAEALAWKAEREALQAQLDEVREALFHQRLEPTPPRPDPRQEQWATQLEQARREKEAAAREIARLTEQIDELVTELAEAAEVRTSLEQLQATHKRSQDAWRREQLELRGQLAEQQEAVERLTTEHDQARNLWETLRSKIGRELSQCKDDLSKLRRELRDRDEEQDRLRDERSELEDIVGQLQDEQAGWTAERQRLSEAVTQQEAEHAARHEELARLREQFAEQERQRARLAESTERLRADLVAERSRWEEERTRLRELVDTRARQASEQHAADLEQARLQLLARERQHTDLTATVRRLRADSERERAEWEAERERLEQLTTAESESQQSQHAAELDDMRRDLLAREQQRTELAGTLHRLQQELEAERAEREQEREELTQRAEERLAELVSEHADMLTRARRQLARREKLRAGLAAQLEQLKVEFGKERDGWQGELQRLRRDAAEQQRALEQRLGASHAEELAVVQTRLTALDGQRETLRRDLAALRDAFEGERREWEQEQAELRTTLDAERTALAKEHAQELDALRKELAEQERLREASATALDRLQTGVELERRDWTAERDRLARNHAERMQELERQHAAALERAAEQLAERERQRASLGLTLKQLQADIEEERAEWSDERERLRELVALRASEIEARHDSERAQWSERLAELEGARGEWALSLQSMQAELERERADWETERGELRRLLEAHEREGAERLEELCALRGQLAHLDDERARLETLAEELRNSFESECDAWTSERGRLEEQLAEQEHRVESLSGEQQRLASRLALSDEERERLAAELLELQRKLEARERAAAEGARQVGELQRRLEQQHLDWSADRERWEQAAAEIESELSTARDQALEQVRAAVAERKRTEAASARSLQELRNDWERRQAEWEAERERLGDAADARQRELTAAHQEALERARQAEEARAHESQESSRATAALQDQLERQRGELSRAIGAQQELRERLERLQSEWEVEREHWSHSAGVREQELAAARDEALARLRQANDERSRIEAAAASTEQELREQLERLRNERETEREHWSQSAGAREQELASARDEALARLRQASDERLRIEAAAASTEQELRGQLERLQAEWDGERELWSHSAGAREQELAGARDEALAQLREVSAERERWEATAAATEQELQDRLQQLQSGWDAEREQWAQAALDHSADAEATAANADEVESLRAELAEQQRQFAELAETAQALQQELERRGEEWGRERDQLHVQLADRDAAMEARDQELQAQRDQMAAVQDRLANQLDELERRGQLAQPAAGDDEFADEPPVAERAATDEPASNEPALNEPALNGPAPGRGAPPAFSSTLVLGAVPNWRDELEQQAEQQDAGVDAESPAGVTCRLPMADLEQTADDAPLGSTMPLTGDASADDRRPGEAPPMPQFGSTLLLSDLQQLRASSAEGEQPLSSTLVLGHEGGDSSPRDTFVLPTEQPPAHDSISATAPFESEEERSEWVEAIRGGSVSNTGTVPLKPGMLEEAPADQFGAGASLEENDEYSMPEELLFSSSDSTPPVSTADVLARFQALSGGDPLAEEVLEEEEEPPMPVRQASHHGASSGLDEDEEPIEEYMERLLKRVRGGGPVPTASEPRTPAEPQRPAAKPAPKPAPKAVEPVEQDIDEEDEDENFSPRSQAPENPNHLKAMRELANDSARSALAHHRAKDWAVSVRRKQLMAVGSGGICAASTCMLVAGHVLAGIVAVPAAISAMVWFNQARSAARRHNNPGEPEPKGKTDRAPSDNSDTGKQGKKKAKEKRAKGRK